MPGKPVPQGGMTAFAKGNKAFVVHKKPKELGDYRARVAVAAQHAGAVPITGPISVVVAFTLPRPKNHFGTGRNEHVLKASAPAWPTKNPDIDKLLRSLLDALTGVCFNDDNQVVQVAVTKGYVRDGEGPQTVVTVTEMTS